MSQEERIDELILELLETGATPEAVCEDCPELLPDVRRGWREVCALETEISSWFPASTDDCSEAELPSGEMPQIPGYEMLEVLGRGGAGIVYRARDCRLDRTVAIKMLLAGRYAKPRDLDRFWREAKALAGLRHSNIVAIYDVGEHDGRIYFTMEYLAGGSLAKKLKGNPQSAAKTARLVATLADAVHAAHENGIVHRDLTPANVLFSTDDTPKITDFGLARRVDDETGLTLTGIALGTPSFMAPEQAGGRTDVGPRADVYGLGALLYKMLTGRPPFHADTTTATIQQLLSEEPVPPSKLNSRTPRDLETICLKCLRKAPQDRYESALALAVDLRHFERGEPIAARRIGVVGRLSRWARRRPALATSWTLCILLSLGLAVGVVWWRLQEAAIDREVEEDLREVARLQQAADWQGAVIALERARGRLGRGGSSELVERLDLAGHGIEQARREHVLMRQLDKIRLSRMTLAEGRFNPVAERRFNYALADRAYEAAFREAGVGTPADDPVTVGTKLATSPERTSILAALSDWAVCATDESRRAWVLDVARGADRDPWRDRARNRSAWGDRAGLAMLTKDAPLAGQPAHLLIALGERLGDLGGDGPGFLTRVENAHSNDAWAALTLARMLQEGAAPETAVAHYRRALKLHEHAAAIYTNLGLISHARRDWTAAYESYEKALKIDRDFAPAHNNFGLALKGEGKWDDAIHEFREAIRLDPRLAPAHCNLAEIRAYSGGLSEAIDHYRQALEIDPEFAPAEYLLGVSLLARGRLDEPHERGRPGVGLKQSDTDAYNDIIGIAARDEIEHYHQALYMDPRFHATYNNLGMTPHEAAPLNEAVEHFQRALRITHRTDPRLDNWVHAELGQALLAVGRFGEAEAATRRCLDRLPKDEPLRANLDAQLRRCQRLISLQARLPAALAGEDKPRNPGETLELAELCGIISRFAAAAHFYAEAFAAAPRAEDPLSSSHRYTAACAAALAGSGRGDDGATLGEADRAHWRSQSRDWLRAELTVWAKTLDSGSQPDRLLVLPRLAHLWIDPDLDGLFDPEAQLALPAAERDECRALWGEIKDLVRRAQAVK